MKNFKKLTLFALVALVIAPVAAAQDSKDFIPCDRNLNTSCFEQFLDLAKADPRAFRDVRSETSYGQVRIQVTLVNTPRPYIQFDGPDDSHVKDLRNGESVTPVSEKLLSSDSLIVAAYAYMYLAGLAGKKSKYPETLQDSEYAALESQVAKAERRIALLKQSFIATQNHGVWECDTSGCYEIAEEEAKQRINEQTKYFLD